ncbi:MAG: N-formylglutamate amidohydrolase [Alphaproteobacteria bacterium]|nr:N-formylglutamate amidohydrolase [Alphaproteobacteria bacterium]
MLPDHDAVEWIPATGTSPAVVLTCEHASERLPSPYAWPEEDARLAGTHWAFDLGIAPFARALAAELGAPAVLSRFSRLLVDPNRPLDAPTLFRDVADGAPVHLNTGLDAAERAQRIERFYTPYHAACDAAVAQAPGAAVLGLHSYTPLYEGAPRAVEVGVLFEDDTDLGAAWLELLDGHGYDVRPNEPWSGLEGLMYSPQLHARRHGRRAIELEIRNDLLADPDQVARLVALVAHAVRATLP